MRPGTSQELASLLAVIDPALIVVGEGLSRRSVYYLRSIASALQKRLMTTDQVAALGWTKARMLAARALRSGKRITKTEASAAKGMTASGLLSNSSVREVMSFPLTAEDAAAVRAALMIYGAPAGGSDRDAAKALTALCKAVSTARGSDKRA